MAYSAKLNYEAFECVTCEPSPSLSLSLVMCVRFKFQKRRFYAVENNSSRDY